MITEQAKHYAMQDIGLTEYEADDAVNNFNWDNGGCETCGAELENYEDDFCKECWDKWNEKQFGSYAKAKNMSVQEYLKYLDTI